MSLGAQNLGGTYAGRRIDVDSADVLASDVKTRAEL